MAEPKFESVGLDNLAASDSFEKIVKTIFRRAKVESLVIIEGREYTTDNIFIGREQDNDLVIKTSLSVSRRHAVLTNTNQGLFITDLNSTNGTFVNGRRLKAYARTPITTEDKIWRNFQL